MKTKQTGRRSSRLPIFSGAGDTLRVSPGPLPAMRKLSFRLNSVAKTLHNFYTAKIGCFSSCRIKSF